MTVDTSTHGKYPASMRIRMFRPADAAALATLFHASVHEIGARDYSSEQVLAWSPRPAEPDDFLRHVSDGREVFVAVDSIEEPIAFIELEADGHIDYFYCRPDVAGTGVGSALYDHLENIASEHGIELLFVEASEAAKRFFTRKGFAVDCRRDFKRSGIAIHNYRMMKALAG